jgi:hypothetical protein
MKLARTYNFIALIFLKVYYMFEQFHCPFSYSARGIPISKNIIKWLISEDSNSLGFKTVMKLLSAHDYCITYLFHFLVVFLGTCQDFRDQLYWDLLTYFLVIFHCFFLLHESSAHYYM